MNTKSRIFDGYMLVAQSAKPRLNSESMNIKRRGSPKNSPRKTALSRPRRSDGRTWAELRDISFEPGYIKHPEGSVLISMGNTKVICSVSVEDSVPPWMAKQGKSGGWLTAEYSMLPRATHTRSQRETRGPSGRTQEIQRLIGRSLRAMINLNALGSRTLAVDCDVIQADGGTRTASINGAAVAAHLAIADLVRHKIIPREAATGLVGAVSVGIIDGQPTLDLCYEEDSRADVDMNVVMTSRGELIEVQGTAEGKSFSRALLNQMLDLAEAGIKDIFKLQRSLIG